MSSKRVVIRRLLKLAYVPPQGQQQQGGQAAAGGGGMDLMALLGGGGQPTAAPAGDGGTPAGGGGGDMLATLLGGGGGGAPALGAGAQQGQQPQDTSISPEEMQQISPDEFTATTPEMQTVLDAMGEVRAALDKLNEAIKALSQQTGGAPAESTPPSAQPSGGQQAQPQQPAKSAKYRLIMRKPASVTRTLPVPIEADINLLRFLEGLL